uniref:Cyanobacterial aminoacyl-tRNA synthetase CAAD domain-containing protein n=1 Tax=Oryza rufipogon TaxID=4529 RepID=A0A0E0QSI3_ORYRU
MAPAAAAAAALVRLPLRPARATLPNQGTHARTHARRDTVHSPRIFRCIGDGRAKTLVLFTPQGFGRRRAGASSLAVRAKDSDDLRVLISEKPAEPAPAKREGWEGFGREVGDGDGEVQVQGESTSWNVLNQIGVEVPQVMEVVGLGFTVWFTSRYLIFKENRDELITRIGSIKKQILGSRGD